MQELGYGVAGKVALSEIEEQPMQVHRVPNFSIILGAPLTFEITATDNTVKSSRVPGWPQTPCE